MRSLLVILIALFTYAFPAFANTDDLCGIFQSAPTVRDPETHTMTYCKHGISRFTREPTYVIGAKLKRWGKPDNVAASIAITILMYEGHYKVKHPAAHVIVVYSEFSYIVDLKMMRQYCEDPLTADIENVFYCSKDYMKLMLNNQLMHLREE